MSTTGNPSACTLQIQHWDSKQDGALSESAMREKLTLLGYDCQRYEYPPGAFFSDHSHAVDKIDAVISGRFRISSGTDSVILEPGDYVHVPRGIVHSAEVIGEAIVVSIDGVKKD